MASTNSLLLVDDGRDGGGPFAGSVVLNGGAGTIQNSQCSVSGVGSSVKSGHTLTLMLTSTFKSPLVGNRPVWVAGRDQAGANNTDWQAMGRPTYIDSGGNFSLELQPVGAWKSRDKSDEGFDWLSGFLRNWKSQSVVNAAFVGWRRTFGPRNLIPDPPGSRIASEQGPAPQTPASRPVSSPGCRQGRRAVPTFWAAFRGS